ncbi:hypothetical protein [Bradyrhizobium sp. USDA 313]|uniref:hypothetical protein n=1 Tax=Bradyrhizobium sp. USDA 313 TaxID=3156307 RepID=UPI003516939E
MNFETPEILASQVAYLPTVFNRELVGLMVRWSTVNGSSTIGTVGRNAGFIDDVQKLSNRYFDKIDNYRARGADVDAAITAIGDLAGFAINRAQGPTGEVEPPPASAAV